jgi:hypothetical protein
MTAARTTPRPDIERPNTVAGLIDKRRELLRLVAEAQDVLQDRLASLDHLTATILLFDPDADLTGQSLKRAPSPHRAFKGEMRRHVLQSLRTAKGPITSLDITRTFIEGRGMDHDGTITVRKRVSACLWKLGQTGLAVSIPLEGEYKGWRVAHPPSVNGL